MTTGKAKKQSMHPPATMKVAKSEYCKNRERPIQYHLFRFRLIVRNEGVLDGKNEPWNGMRFRLVRRKNGVLDRRNELWNGMSMSSLCSSNFSSVNSTTNSSIRFEWDAMDYQVPLKDITLGRPVGDGACGTVFHGQWLGSDVAVKKFCKKEYTEEVFRDFRQEVNIMKRLRHPNILLFMGIVASPQQLCIVTEFLQRGSLFTVLRDNAQQLNERKRVKIALDIARGVNYLHQSNPPVVHCDLKSSNILVDGNWNAKVGDFGLSRLKYGRFLEKAPLGTPQYTAPEIFREEPSDEKSDVYSYGVILWELATGRIPWEETCFTMQVVVSVKYMNERLKIPDTVDRQWASIIQSCWDSDPEKRPTFQELVEKFKLMHRQYGRAHRQNGGNAHAL